MAALHSPTFAARRGDTNVLRNAYACLVCDSCSSGRSFACGFLQIPGHLGHPCCSANGPTIRVRRGFPPPSHKSATMADSMGLAPHASCRAHNNKKPLISQGLLYFSGRCRIVNWRRGRDSNPRYVSVHLISSQAPSTTRTPLHESLKICIALIA